MVNIQSPREVHQAQELGNSVALGTPWNWIDLLDTFILKHI